jgi:hypothetical protein
MKTKHRSFSPLIFSSLTVRADINIAIQLRIHLRRTFTMNHDRLFHQFLFLSLTQPVTFFSHEKVYFSVSKIKD